MGSQHTKYIILLPYHVNLQEKNIMLTKLKWPKNSFLHSILWNWYYVYYTLENAEPERFILVLYLRRTIFKGVSHQGYGFSSGHVQMWVLDYEEGWVPKNLCFWTVVLERTLGSPLDCREIKPIKGKSVLDVHWRTDAEAETPKLWPPDVKNWLPGKDPDAGKDWGQEEMGTTEDGMVGWHHQLDGHEFEQASGVGDGQGSLACCSPWDSKESDTAERLNWTDI